MPFIPVSWGELIDKITILQIKAAALKKKAAIANVRRELRLLSRAARPALARPGVKGLMAQLKTINRTLWKAEDGIRAKEARNQFDARFVSLARSVYRTNDARAALKKKINTLLASRLFEEKSYRHS
jgi:hypothetical protein